MKYFQSWVKKLISQSQWDNWNSKIETYCFLGKQDGGVWIGFLTSDPSPALNSNTKSDPNYVPEGCFKMIAEDLFQVDSYRRARNIRPFPLGEIREKKTEKAKQSTLDKLDQMKKHLANTLSIKKNL